MITTIKNGRVIADGEISVRDISFMDGKIVCNPLVPDRIIDASNMYVSPGFIDLHLHGGGGYDFMDGDVESFRKIAEFHGKHGTTAMCPTFLSSPFEEMIQSFSAYSEVKEKGCNGSDFIGIHLEGPYFADSQRGAQDPRFIRPPLKEEYERLLEASSDIVRWSAAPERDAGFDFAKELVARNILPSAGHTDANCHEMLEAVKHGYTHMTHLYSGMKGLERINGIRIAGAVEASYISDNITVELISDGMHLPLEILLMVYKIKGADKVCLITDAIRGAGLPDGTDFISGSRKNGRIAKISNGVAWMPDGQTFAGSVATTDRLLQTAVRAGIPLTQAVTMLTKTPASIIGCRNKGSLECGKDADIVILSKELRAVNVLVRGKQII